MLTAIPRRQFLTSATGTIVGLSLIETPVADAQVLEAFIAAMLWLGENILAPVAVAYFTEWVKNATLVRSSNDGSFHDRFSPTVAFNSSFNPQPTRWDGYLGSSRGLPSMCSLNNATKVGELNLPEINALKDNTNPYLYNAGGLRLAPVPNSVRTYPTAWDLRIAGDDMRRNYQNPANYQVRYARSFCDCSGIALHGFSWSNLRTSASGFRIVQIA